MTIVSYLDLLQRFITVAGDLPTPRIRLPRQLVGYEYQIKQYREY